MHERKKKREKSLFLRNENMIFEVVCSIEMQHSVSLGSKACWRLTGTEGPSRRRGSETAGVESREKDRSSYETNCSN